MGTLSGGSARLESSSVSPQNVLSIAEKCFLFDRMGD